MRLGSMGSRSGWLYNSGSGIQFVGWRDKGLKHQQLLGWSFLESVNLAGCL